MDKQLKGMMPKPEKTSFVTGSPLNDTKSQGGHEQDNIASGNLRHHNGGVCTIPPKARK